MADIITMIDNRFPELVAEGDALVEQFKRNEPIDWNQRPKCVSWLLSVVNLLEAALPQGNRHRVEAERLLPKTDSTIYPERVATILGILRSAQAEWSSGLLLELEFKFVGPAFEQFLQHAKTHLKDKKKMEAAVLASAVLEDTIKKLCRKFEIDPSGKELDPLINALKTKGVLSKVKAARLLGAAAVRNQAFHAEWDKFDERDIKQLIDSVEELIESFFTTA